MATQQPVPGAAPITRVVRVWDLPVRLFHWVLVLLLIASFTTGKLGGNWLQWHFYSGYAILALVLFRIVWGLMGSQTARFSNFIRGPVHVFRYGRSLLTGPPQFHAGHNPLGGLMVVLMIVLLLVQATTGLFVDDDIATRGPLADKVSDSTISLLTRIHRLNINLLLGCVAIHIAAALFYLFVKKDNLIAPMFTGTKAVPEDHPEPVISGIGSAIVLILLIATFVTWLVKYFPK